VAELIEADGGVLHYDVLGPAEGPVILAIEGLGAHLIAWRAGFLQPFIDAGFRVVRLDNRDVGRSQRYSRAYGIGDMAEDVHELIVHLGIRPAHVLGQSMGGMIAQHLVLRHPEDVASLTLLYTAASPRHILGDARTVETLVAADRPATRAEAIEQYVEQERLCASTAFPFDEDWKRELGGLMWDRGHDSEGVARQAHAVFTHEADLDALAGIDVPTLLIHGTSDLLIDPAASKELHEVIAGSELWLVDGMGHEIPKQLWFALTSRIIAHARSADRGASRVDGRPA
jgi:pimeloyl-ACP methyl ester carboxylesterase